MELELERTQRSGYETVLETTVTHEETMEMIVPDACPDILRICDTGGAVCLRSKEVLEGRVEVLGSVKASVLYLPDGEEGMRKLEVPMPFTCGVDAAGVTGQCTVVAIPRVTAAETRSLNPRKVLVRVNLAVAVQVYAPVFGGICTGVPNPEEAGVQQLVERYDSCVTACVQEKPFTFSDEIVLSGSKPEMEELLRHRLALQCGEAKVIGSKLIFKGEVQLQALYRAEGGALCTAEFELPFSQIMEVNGAGEESTCQVQVLPTSSECILGGDGRTLSVTLGLLAQAVVREERSLDLLTDVYSTAYDLSVETELCQVDRLLDWGRKEQLVREILEVGAPAREVCDAYADIGTVTQSREGNRLTIAAEANVTVLYLSEEGSRTAVTRAVQAVCALELKEGAVCSCLCTCPATVFATPTSGGVEVRFQVDFQYTALESRSVVGVSALRMDETAPRDTSAQPSIVLRMVGEQERLWDIAKAYATTQQDIMQANDLEDGTVPGGKLLLIPKKR